MRIDPPVIPLMNILNSLCALTFAPAYYSFRRFNLVVMPYLCKSVAK